MGFKRKVSTFLLFLSAFCPSLHSEEAALLQWEDCFLIALNNNPNLLSATQALKSSQYSYRSALNGYLPDVSLSSRYSDSEGHPKDSRWQAQGSASMDVFNTATIADVKSASAVRDSSVASLMIASADTLADLRSAFVDLLFSQEQVQVSEKIRKIRKENSQMVSLKYQSGRESKGNMLKSKAEMGEAEANLSQAQRGLQVSQRELNRQMGNLEFSAIVATGTLNVSAPGPFEITAEKVSDHPRVLLQYTQKRRARAGLASARSQLWPSLTANYSRSATGTTYFPNDDLGWTFSGVLSYPLFSGGPTSAFNNIKAAQADLAGAEEDYRATVLEVSQNLESRWASLADAVDQVKVQREFLEAARQRNSEAAIRYSSGLISYEDWERAVTDLVNFERGVVQADRQAALAQAELGRAMGVPMEKP